MAFRLWLVILLLALAAVVECSTSFNGSPDEITHHPSSYFPESVEDSTETLMDSETNRRQLAAKRYISYGALKKNSVPCNRRGQSYYNCNSMKRANPYRRGCSVQEAHTTHVSNESYVGVKLPSAVLELRPTITVL